MSWFDTSDPCRRVIGNALRHQAETSGDQIFLMDETRRLTFAEVNDQVNSYAHGFARLGVGAGDPVSIFMRNSLEFAMVALALNKIGAVWIPTNTGYKDRWLAETLEDARSRLVVADRELVPRIAGVRKSVPELRQAVVLGGLHEERVEALTCLPFGVLDTGRTDEPHADVRHDSLSAVMWTSGTTGRAKGIMQSQGCWLYNAAVMALCGIRDGDVLYCCVPMFNSGGWSLNVFSALVCGVAIGIDPAFSVTEFWDRCRHYRATHTLTLGAMHMFLWNAPRSGDDADNPVRVAAAVPMPHETIGPFKERFGIDVVWQGFGQSEVLGTTLCDTTRADWKPNSCGVARPDLEVKLLDDDDREVPIGEVGEVCIRPREPGIIFSGYYNRPDRTVEAWRNLWYHSGDLARFDSDGELYFVDRKADFMRFGGRNISSFDVERVVLGHDAVEMAAAHGVRSAELASEEEVKICVVLKAGRTVTEWELAEYINEHAPYYLVPRYIEFLEELPQTPTERVQKFALRARGVTPATWDRRAAGFQVTR